MSTPSQAPVVVSRIQNRRGTQSQFYNLYPPGYLGIGGFGSIPGYNITNYPDVLMPGELGLCSDTRRIFMGNINGEYIEIAEQMTTEIFFNPVSIVLPPVAIFTVIPELTYLATPFTAMLYSMSDSMSPDWNQIGTNFGRNGELQITAVAPFAPPPPNPPFPTPTPATLTDVSTEINLYLPDGISFKAQYDLTNTNIEIFYMHNFPVSVMFNTTALKWTTF